MAYFLGKDVNVYLTTEHSGLSLSGSMHATSGNLLTAVIEASSSDTGILALERSDGIATSTQLSDVTGIDFSPGATNEDITYMGKNTSLSAQIKNEFSITLTKKKNDLVWDQMFNDQGRNGVYSKSGSTITADATSSGYSFFVHDGLTTPKLQNFGYRLYLTLKDESEIFVLRNCCMTGHTVSLNADGTQEETAEFYSYVKPRIVTGSSVAAVTDATLLADI